MATGCPLAGDKMLRDDSMRSDASICDSGESGIWTAIWSPSKSALNAVQTSGVDPDGLTFDENGLESLNPEAMERRRAVEQHGMLANDFFEKVPHLGPLRFDHFLRGLDRRGETDLFELVVDELA